MGDDQEEDEIILSENDEQYYLDIKTSKDKVWKTLFSQFLINKIRNILSFILAQNHAMK